MADVLTAVYENGILRPLGPVTLRERQTVRLEVLPDEPVDEADQIIEKLAQCRASVIAAWLFNRQASVGEETPESCVQSGSRSGQATVCDYLMEDGGNGERLFPGRRRAGEAVCRRSRLRSSIQTLTEPNAHQ